MNGWICLIWVVVVLLFPGGVMYEIVMLGGGGRYMDLIPAMFLRYL